MMMMVVVVVVVVVIVVGFSDLEKTFWKKPWS